MENKNQKESFHYTYSAKEQEELKKIRQKYQPREENKMEQIRRLDAGVTKKASVCALTLGIVGTLTMGSGMSLTMTDLGKMIGLSGNASMIVGIVVGMIGIILIGCAYPFYHRVLENERERVAPEILRLADELMK